MLHQSLVASLPAQLFDQLHSDWQKVLSPLEGSILRIDKQLSSVETAPEYSNIFRSLCNPINRAKVVIFGQDPYPTKGHADGLAFSVDSSVKPLPASLRNIYTELLSDTGTVRINGDLSDWSEQGVLLINRILSIEVGSSLSHATLGWQEVTNVIAAELGKRKVVAVLWGKNAGELAPFFRPEWKIQSVHPSPLSAYRGFFGSKPFSKCNQILVSNNLSAINW